MQDYEPNIDRLLALYQQLEDDIIASMIQRMLKMGYVSESTKYEAEVLQASGLLYEDILRLIAERMDATVQQVRALFEDAGVQTVNIDNEAHEAAGEVPIDIRQDKGMKQVLEAGYKKTLGTMHNLVSTTATQSQTAFIAACDRAYMQVSSGAFSYQQAIRQAVKSFGDIGAMVQYPSGHRDRLDVAMRRAVLTGVGQTSSAVALEHAKKSGCYLMELTAHSGARPEHAAWQGQLVSLNGKDVGKTIDGLRVHSLSAIGYGSGAGFKGWNCRHNWHPYYPGLSTPNYTKAQLAKLDARDILYDGKLYTEYEISQKQREAERHVRALKRRVVASQTAVQNAPDEATKAALEADYTQNAVKLKAAEKQLRDFCKDTGRRNDTFRTQVAGFGRSEAQRAVMANKKALQQKAAKHTNTEKQQYEGLTSDNESGIIRKKAVIDIKSVDKIARTMPSSQEKEEFVQLINDCQNEDVKRSYARYCLQLETVEKGKSGYYQPQIKKLVYRYQPQRYIDRGRSKYSTLAHEYGHFTDHVGQFKTVTYNEVEQLNDAISQYSSITWFRKVPSSSDAFLSALRKDKEALRDIVFDKNIRADWFSTDASAGVQDAICGMFGTKRVKMQWVHEDSYYDHRYSVMKSHKLDKVLKDIYKNMGFNARNQATVRDIVRNYETASEMWANIMSAETCGGKELEYIKKYLPNSYNAFVEIMKGLE